MLPLGVQLRLRQDRLSGQTANSSAVLGRHSHLWGPPGAPLNQPHPSHYPAHPTAPLCRSKLEVPAAMLTEQYRMHPSICAAVSKEFYDGRLTTASAACERKAVAAPTRLVHVKGWERHHPGGGYSNAKEASR